MNRFFIGALVCMLGGCATTGDAESGTDQVSAGQIADARVGSDEGPRLGNFSVSLAVKDLDASRAFYEKLGFRPVAGDGRGYLILQDQTCTIGLFQGMFDKNILTFNPGWDRDSNTLPDFDDVRDIQRTLKDRGIEPVLAADESTTGPASLVIVDPDGNQILIDQHVPRPPR